MVPLHKTFTYRLHVLHKLTDVQTQKAFEQSTGLSLSDSRALSVIGSFGPLSVNELASHANLHKGPASRAAQSLVAKKLITKNVQQSDARGIILSLTPRGNEVFSQILSVVEQRNQQITEVLTKKEIEQLNSLIDKLIHSAQYAAERSLEISP
jgi:DNA-binding MarR family transcriptional regulator